MGETRSLPRQPHASAHAASFRSGSSSRSPYLRYQATPTLSSAQREGPQRSVRLFRCLDAVQARARHGIAGVKLQNKVVLITCQAIITAFRSRIGLAEQLRDIMPAEAVHSQSGFGPWFFHRLEWGRSRGSLPFVGT